MLSNFFTYSIIRSIHCKSESETSSVTTSNRLRIIVLGFIIIVASSKVEKFLDNLPVEFEVGEEVDLMVFGETGLGYKAIVDDISTGILYKNEVFQTVKTGQLLKGYIKKIRDDEKIDLSLQRPTVGRFDEFTEKVLSFLKENNGTMPLTDKSPPEAIYEIFGMSKKNFKKAIGALYKKRVIVIDEGAIRLPVKSQGL